MKKTLRQQIDANKRMSFFYALLLVIVLTGLGASIGGFYAPRHWYYGAIGAFAAGCLMAIVARYSGSDIMLAISGAREATHIKDTVLDNVVEEMAIAAGIPKPKIYIMDDSAPNAFATGPDPEHAVVCVTTGLLEKLDRDELQGVISHELSHIRNYDIRFMTTIGLIAGLIPLLADMFRTSLWFGGGRRDSRDNDNNLQLIFFVLSLLLSILAPIFAVLLQLAVSRQREFLADSSGAELTRYPEGLASALIKITNDPEPLEAANRATAPMYIVNPLRAVGDGESSIFSTHPSTRERVERLRSLMGSYNAGIGTSSARQE